MVSTLCLRDIAAVFGLVILLCVVFCVFVICVLYRLFCYRCVGYRLTVLGLSAVAVGVGWVCRLVCGFRKRASSVYGSVGEIDGGGCAGYGRYIRLFGMSFLREIIV